MQQCLVPADGICTQCISTQSAAPILLCASVTGHQQASCTPTVLVIGVKSLGLSLPSKHTPRGLTQRVPIPKTVTHGHRLFIVFRHEGCFAGSQAPRQLLSTAGPSVAEASQLFPSPVLRQLQSSTSLQIQKAEQHADSQAMQAVAVELTAISGRVSLTLTPVKDQHQLDESAPSTGQSSFPVILHHDANTEPGALAGNGSRCASRATAGMQAAVGMGGDETSATEQCDNGADEAVSMQTDSAQALSVLKAEDLSPGPPLLDTQVCISIT